MLVVKERELTVFSSDMIKSGSVVMNHVAGQRAFIVLSFACCVAFCDLQAKNIPTSDKTDMKKYVARFENTFLKGLYKTIRAKKRDKAERIAAATTDF